MYLHIVTYINLIYMKFIFKSFLKVTGKTWAYMWCNRNILMVLLLLLLWRILILPALINSQSFIEIGRRASFY